MVTAPRPPAGPDPAPAPVGPARVARAGRIPSLDGLRAVSIAFAVIAHVSGDPRLPASWGRSFTEAVRLGRFGVAIFFAISGFLITTLLLEERAREGRVRLGRFYLRRTLRIFPPFYVYCGVIALLAAAGLVRLLPGDLFHAMTYTLNWAGPRSWFVAHAWSLTLEEQFYLVWPALLLALGRERGVWLAVAVVVLGPEARLASFLLGGGVGGDAEATYTMLNNVDALAAGAALACLRPGLRRSAWYGRALASRWSAAVPLVTLVAWNGFGGHWGVGLVSATVAVVGVALTMDRVIAHPAGWSGRLLNSAPFVFVGQLSYSLYLWQQLFSAGGDPSIGPIATSVVTRFPVNLGVMFAAAVLSFYLVERPSLAVRRAVERRWFPSPGRARAASAPPPDPVLVP